MAFLLTLRGSYDAASSKAAIHMVSAWATANHNSLGPVIVFCCAEADVDEKSNGITAILEGEADYCLAVKGKQRRHVARRGGGNCRQIHSPKAYANT